MRLRGPCGSERCYRVDRKMGLVRVKNHAKKSITALPQRQIARDAQMAAGKNFIISKK